MSTSNESISYQTQNSIGILWQTNQNSQALSHGAGIGDRWICITSILDNWVSVIEINWGALGEPGGRVVFRSDQQGRSCGGSVTRTPSGRRVQMSHKGALQGGRSKCKDHWIEGQEQGRER
jgi:hypothetical protein